MTLITIQNDGYINVSYGEPVESVTYYNSYSEALIAGGKSKKIKDKNRIMNRSFSYGRGCF
jgi:hypothetical protein